MVRDAFAVVVWAVLMALVGISALLGAGLIGHLAVWAWKVTA